MISVCIATYNGAAYIRQQIASILPQLSEGDEIVVSDDGSTDATLAEVRALGSPLVRIVEGPRKGSPVLNFENALSHAKGDYLFLCDQDDVWEPHKVSVMMAALREVSCVVSDCTVVDARLRQLSPSFYSVVRKHEGRWYNLLVRNCYLGCCMAFRREVLERALPFPPSVAMHDIWLGNVAAFFFTLRFIPDRLMSYRRHGANASTTSDPSSHTLAQKLAIRLRVVRALLQRCGGRK